MLPLFVCFISQSPEDGAIGFIKGMMDSDAESGKLYGPLKFKGLAVPIPPKSHETDSEAKCMLWESSKKATGVKFDI